MINTKELLNYQSLFNSLRDPTRLAIISHLQESPYSVTDLCQFFTISNPALTRHVQVLAKAGIISGERKGREVVYCLNEKEVSESLIRFAFLISKKGK